MQSMSRSLTAALAGAGALLLASIFAAAALAQDDAAAAKPKPDLTPGKGFKIYEGDKGALTFSLYTYLRYLNQRGLDETYTDSFGRTRTLDQRDDLQLQKALLYFKGWLGRPEFRYLAYVWTSNTSQGQGAQVVLAGNLTYRFNEHVEVGGGIGGLPTTRSTRGTWPAWLKQDNRTIADEYFRGSYTSGIWANGDVTPGLHYKAMLGNNLSQLGVDAGQLDAGMNTYSGALWWTTGGFGAYEGLGDFEGHETWATSLGAAFTASRESRQNQPGTEDPENTQIRVSDGTGIFQIYAFGDSLAIEQADYRMSAFDGAVKYRGYALEGEYFVRWVENLKWVDLRSAGGDLPVADFFDQGFQLQASMMAMPKQLMLYGFTSKIFGEYGEPWEVGGGVNYYPFKTRILRFNPEIIYVDESPVGYLSYPLLVGAKGPVFMANIELYF
jgi:hypothetical protein